MLDDAGLEALKVTHGKIGEVTWYGHQLVFKRPTREQIRDFRRKQDSPAEKPDATDQLSQQTLIAFDGVTDPAAARAQYLGFLVEYPAFTDSPKLNACLNVLSGIVEVADTERLGKSVRIFPPIQAPTRTVSENGADGSATAVTSPSEGRSLPS